LINVVAAVPEASPLAMLGLSVTVVSIATYARRRVSSSDTST
jgi:hypothetical protein